MSSVHDEREEPGIITPAIPQDEEPENLFEQLAAKRRELAETNEVNIPVPGYDKEPPLLLVRYRHLDGTELDKLANKIRRETKGRWQRTLLASIDTFITAVVGLYVDMGDGVPRPLTYHGEPITTFGPDLAEAMQFADKVPNPNNHRDVVLGLFGNNDVAIAQHNYLLNRWFGDTSLVISQELLEGNF